jgi:hypothetical protein
MIMIMPFMILYFGTEVVPNNIVFKFIFYVIHLIFFIQFLVITTWNLVDKLKSIYLQTTSTLQSKIQILIIYSKMLMCTTQVLVQIRRLTNMTRILSSILFFLNFHQQWSRRKPLDLELLRNHVNLHAASI